MAENNSSAPLKTAEGAYPPLPEPRTFDKYGWGCFSDLQMRAYVDAARAQTPVAAEPMAYVLGDPRYADSSNVFMSHQFTPDGEHEDEWTPLYAVTATPKLPATEDSSAGDLATESVLIEGVAYTIPEPVALELLRLNIELQLAEVQAEPVAWANWKVGSTSYAPYRTRKQAEASVNQSEIAATQEGPYEVVPLYTAPQAQPAFQQRVQPWMMECFGAEIAADRIERNHRFLEEALELVQATGCTKYEAFKLVNYVFKRPVGKPAQEVGGVMVTLAAHCLANGLDMQACAETELERIWTKVPEIRAKQAAKPKHSPLPMAQDADPLDEISEALHDYHYALDTRQHGGVAAGTAINAIEAVLEMHWQQGQETNRRAAMAAAQEGGKG